MTIEPFISPKDQGASIESYAHSLEIQNVVHVDAAIPVAADDSAVMNIIADHSAMANAAQEKDPPSAVWSWWSNLFFLFGSLSYVLLAGLAFHIDGQAFSSNAAEFPTPSPTTFSEGGTRKHPRWWEVSYYQLVGAMAALWFFGNAVVDLAWALDDRRHQRQARFGGDDPRWDIGLAITFGMAASCDFLSCVLANYKYTYPSIALAIAAVHVYLLYALVALSGRTFKCQSLDQTLTSAGDVLFLLGSIIDVVLSYFLTEAVTFDNWHSFDWSSMASALLWTGNAVFCIAADAVAAHEEKRRNNDLFVMMASPTDRRPEVDLTERLS